MSEQQMTADRISKIKLCTKRYIVDSRYSDHRDWHNVVSPQDVLFLVELSEVQAERIADLEFALDHPELSENDNVLIDEPLASHPTTTRRVTLHLTNKGKGTTPLQGGNDG